MIWKITVFFNITVRICQSTKKANDSWVMPVKFVKNIWVQNICFVFLEAGEADKMGDIC